MSRLEDQEIANILAHIANIDTRLSNVANGIFRIETNQSTILNNQEKIMTDMNTFTSQMADKLTSIETLDDSLFTLLSSLSAEVAANKNDPAALDAILARVEADKTKLMNAVVANTPVVVPPTPAASVTDPASTSNVNQATPPATNS